MSEESGQVVIHDAGGRELELALRGESAWLAAPRLAELFEVEPAVVERHLRALFDDDELPREEHARADAGAERYSVDVVIALSYRIRSPRALKVRQWATRTLREYLLRGYSLNENRLRDRGLDEMQEALELLGRTLQKPGMLTDEGRGVLDVVSTYARSWLLLLQYDEDRLPLPPTRHAPVNPLGLERARKAIGALKLELMKQGAATDLFGRERGTQLEAILASLEQTFGGQPLYPSAEERAAHLLYFIIKDHPFTDGNKRIGAFLFALYLWENAPAVAERLDNDALVAMALLTAESEARNKDLLIRLILNLLSHQP